MKNKTFEEFRLSRKRLSKEEVEKLCGYEINSKYAHVYNDLYVIEEQYLPSGEKFKDKYGLVICRCDFYSKNIDELEAKLWLFICEELDLYEEEIKIRNKYNIFEKDWYY